MTTLTKTQALRLGALSLAVMLSACGGGGGGGDSATPPAPNPAPTPAPSPAPAPSDGQYALQTSVPPASYVAGSAEAKVFDLMNAERGRCGFGLVAESTKLNAAASGHSNYLKERFAEGILPGHTEDPAKSAFYAATAPERAARAGFEGTSSGDLLSYYTLGTTADYGDSLVRAMMATVYHMAGMLDGNRNVGISVSYAGDSAPTGFKLAALVWQAGTATGVPRQEPNTLVSYPCDGSTGLQPYMYGENPDPFSSMGFKADAGVGHPLYFRAPAGKAIRITAATLTSQDGKSIPVTPYHAENDPTKQLGNHQAFVIPREALAENTSYTAQVMGTINGETFSRNMVFRTRTIK